MNYCEKIRYTIYRTVAAEFGQMVDNLLAQLPDYEVILRLTFFGMPASNEEYLERRVRLRERIRRHYGNYRGSSELEYPHAYLLGKHTSLS